MDIVIESDGTSQGTKLVLDGKDITKNVMFFTFSAGGTSAPSLDVEYLLYEKAGPYVGVSVIGGKNKGG